MLFPEAKNEEKKKYILENPAFKKALDELEADRQHYLNTPIEPVPFNKFKAYFTEGNRQKYEDLYFARRGRLTTFSMAILLYSREEDILALEDAIWAICEEYTWVLPAHIKDSGDCYDRNYIDLFSAETAFALSEIHYLLGDVLDKKILRRIEECVEERIFNIYPDGNFAWKTIETNWAAVCSAGVAASYIYLAPEKFDEVKPMINKTMDCFLASYGTDGCCVEGIEYWTYGFGFFVYYAQLLYEFTDGKENLFNLPICEKAAQFQQNIFLRKNITVSFADGSRQCVFQPGIIGKLQKIYGKKIASPNWKYSGFAGYCHRFPTYLRNFFWASPEKAQEDLPLKEFFYPDADWYIYSNNIFSLAAKAGHNDEPHNHNDIGSFLIASDDGQILCDIGAGAYTRDYFSSKRYEYTCTASRGHNLPIINGCEQHFGKEYKGQILKAENGEFAVEFASAYPAGAVKSVNRNIKVSENEVSICDKFSFDTEENEVVERFVTLIKPKVCGNTIKIGRFSIKSSCETAPVISSENISDHSHVSIPLYKIDFMLKNCSEFLLTLSE